MIPELQDHSNVANKEKAIGEVCRVIPGFAFKSKDLGDSGVPVVKIGSITGSGVVDLDSGQFLPEGLIEDRHEKYCLDQGDIVLAMTGEGKIGRIVDDRKSLLNQRVCKIEPLDEKDRAFLWVAIKSIDYSQLFAQLAKGAAQANISGGQIEAIRIAWPEARARNRIADILSSYDDLIENNRRRIKLLEESARLLYREWFVHLRFPGHEHVRVVDGVPEGWGKRHLSEIARITMGQSPSSDHYNTDEVGFPFHQGVTNFGDRFVQNRTWCDIRGRMASPGDILFSVRAPVGRLNVARDELVLGRGLAAMRSLDDRQSMLFYQLGSHFFKEDMIGGGAIFASVTKRDLENQLLLCPTDHLAAEFERFAGDVDRQIENLVTQIEKLQVTRDLLLPRLMSGEISV